MNKTRKQGKKKLHLQYILNEEKTFRKNTIKTSNINGRTAFFRFVKYILGVLFMGFIGALCNEVVKDVFSPTGNSSKEIDVNFHYDIPLSIDSKDSVKFEQVKEYVNNLERITAIKEIEKKQTANRFNIPMNENLENNGYVLRDASIYCSISINKTKEGYIDVAFDFFNDETINNVKAFALHIFDTSGERYLIRQLYYPQKGNNNCIRLSQSSSINEQSRIEAGFFLNQDLGKEYPTFYSSRLYLKD